MTKHKCLEILHYMNINRTDSICTLYTVGTVNKPRGQPYGGGGSLKDHVLPHEGGRG